MPKPAIVAHGKWNPSIDTSYQFTGVCQKCYAKTEAVNLKLKRLPFGRGEIWACGDCYYTQRKES